jgi:hypothetical protein
MLHANSLEVVTEVKYKNPEYFQPIAAQTVLLGLTEYAHSMPGVEEYVEDLAKEHAKGTFVDVEWSVVVGRKGVV